MFKLYFLKEILTSIVIVFICVIVVLIYLIKYKFDTKSKENCYQCKSYKLYDVSSCGDRCKYKCNLKNRIDNHKMNDKVNFIKCDEFKCKK